MSTLIFAPTEKEKIFSPIENKEEKHAIILIKLSSPLSLTKGKDQYVEHDARDAVWLVQDVVLPKVLTHNAKASAISRGQGRSRLIYWYLCAYVNIYTYNQPYIHINTYPPTKHLQIKRYTHTYAHSHSLKFSLSLIH